MKLLIFEWLLLVNHICSANISNADPFMENVLRAEVTEAPFICDNNYTNYEETQYTINAMNYCFTLHNGTNFKSVCALRSMHLAKGSGYTQQELCFHKCFLSTFGLVENNTLSLEYRQVLAKICRPYETFTAIEAFCEQIASVANGDCHKFFILDICYKNFTPNCSYYKIYVKRQTDYHMNFAVDSIQPKFSVLRNDGRYENPSDIVGLPGTEVENYSNASLGYTRYAGTDIASCVWRQPVGGLHVNIISLRLNSRNNLLNYVDPKSFCDC